MPIGGASGGHVRRRRGSRRATVPAMDEGNADLLTVGLVVFFVALIVVVAALLIVPALV